MRAEITCSYDDEKVSEAVASSVRPDNIDSPEGVEVKTERNGDEVRSEIVVDGEIETLLATMEDLLACTSVAEDMI